MTTSVEARSAAEEVVGKVEAIDVDPLVDEEELEALRSDGTFQGLAVSYRELSTTLRHGSMSTSGHTRTFADGALSKLSRALSERAQTVLGRPVPDEREETLPEPFAGVVVQDDPVVVVDDGEEARSFPWIRADVELGDGLRVSVEGVEEISSERVRELLGLDVEETERIEGIVVETDPIKLDDGTVLPSSLGFEEGEGICITREALSDHIEDHTEVRSWVEEERAESGSR